MKNYRMIDLTHIVHPQVPTWDLSCGCAITTLRDYHQDSGDDRFRAQSLELKAGVGTHIDSPAHCFKGASDVSQIPLEQLFLPCYVIDISLKNNELYQLSSADIEAFEEKQGKIPAGSAVIVYTGWSKYWDTPEKYHNQHSFPSVSEEGATLLLKRNITALGIDTLSPDCGKEGYPVHRIFLGAHKLIIENVAHADKLSPTGSFLLIMPLKFQGATESPIRLMGLIPSDH